KVQAETEKIRLQNKITKEITYDQLKTESKQKDIKGKIDIFQRLTKLEEEIKNKENKTASDQKKLESLEMIKKEFKQSFEVEENPKLVETEKKLEVQKENKNKKKRKAEIALKIKNKQQNKKNRIMSYEDKNNPINIGFPLSSENRKKYQEGVDYCTEDRGNGFRKYIILSEKLKADFRRFNNGQDFGDITEQKFEVLPENSEEMARKIREENEKHQQKFIAENNPPKLRYAFLTPEDEL
ncbi:15630_t:CDS:2, partial [Cetraspora pellucida]